MNRSRLPLRRFAALAAVVVATGCATWPPQRDLAIGRVPAEQVAGDTPKTLPDHADRLGGEIAPVLRGQSPRDTATPLDRNTPGTGDHFRYPMSPSGSLIAPTRYVAEAQAPATQSTYVPSPYGGPAGGPPPGFGPPGPSAFNGLPGPSLSPPYGSVTPLPGAPGESILTYPDQGGSLFDPRRLPGRAADITITVDEAQTGRFMFGVGVNSDLGATAQIVVDERNFDWRRIPTSTDEILNGQAFRGGGQGFRLEALPGNRVQRYLASFSEPYLFDTAISLNLSGFFFDRNYFDWQEQRLGGRAGLGYSLTHDLSISGSLRAEEVTIHSPRMSGVPELDAVIGDHHLYSGRVMLAHDTRDAPFAPTEGHLLELSYEQVFGSFDFPRGNIDIRQYFLMRERPDGSGRHVFGTTFRFGFSGSQTPVFENFFAGGFSTIRGFDFRGASPKSGDIIVGGEFLFLGSAEYLFPITADDMLRGVVFCDFGTVEEKIDINSDDYRVAPGAGLRIFVPALGPAPIALDLAFPLARESTDRVQHFSFFIGFGR